MYVFLMSFSIILKVDVIKLSISASMPVEDSTISSSGRFREKHSSKRPIRSDGFALAARVRDVCSIYSSGLNTAHIQTYAFEKIDNYDEITKHMLPINNPNSSALYCPVEKVGSTFWRRFVYLLTKNESYQHPLQVPINFAIDKTSKTPEGSIPSMYENDFKFMFVRDPYHRVLSAYIDKLYVPNPYFWNKYGKPAMELSRPGHLRKRNGCYHDLTFEEFVRFVVWSEKNRKQLDAHFQIAAEICSPCTMNFSFIGKMERFKTDALLVVNNFRHQSTVKMLKESMDTLAIDDAIKDSIYSPFS